MKISMECVVCIILRRNSNNMFWIYNKQRELYKCEDNNNPWNKYIEPIEHQGPCYTLGDWGRGP